MGPSWGSPVLEPSRTLDVGPVTHPSSVSSPTSLTCPFFLVTRPTPQLRETETPGTDEADKEDLPTRHDRDRRNEVLGLLVESPYPVYRP